MDLRLEQLITKQYKKKCTAGWQIDYEYKSKVMQSGSLELLNNLSSKLFKKTCNQQFVDDSLDYLFKNYSIFNLKESLRINNAKTQRVTRLKRRIQKICSERAYFLTLTFRDDVLDTTEESTRRQYVRRELNKISTDFVANIDFGSKNDREHYHAVVRADYLDYNFWPYGIMYAEVINPIDEYNLVLAKYVSKLTNHAIKETCKRKSIIYSRKKY